MVVDGALHAASRFSARLASSEIAKKKRREIAALTPS